MFLMSDCFGIAFVACQARHILFWCKKEVMTEIDLESPWKTNLFNLMTVESLWDIATKFLPSLCLHKTFVMALVLLMLLPRSLHLPLLLLPPPRLVSISLLCGRPFYVC